MAKRRPAKDVVGEFADEIWEQVKLIAHDMIGFSIIISMVFLCLKISPYITPPDLQEKCHHIKNVTALSVCILLAFRTIFGVALLVLKRLVDEAKSIFYEAKKTEISENETVTQLPARDEETEIRQTAPDLTKNEGDSLGITKASTNGVVEKKSKYDVSITDDSNRMEQKVVMLKGRKK